MISAVAIAEALSPSPFDLFVQGVVGRTSVRRFTVTERMSQPYVATVDLDALLLGPERVALGARVRLQTPRSDGAGRVFHGVVASVERRGGDIDGTARFRITVEPLFAELRHTRHRRIFHGMSSVQIAEQILREHRVPYRLRLLEERPVHAHRIQYDESDLAFVERILFEEGIFYFFDHPGEDATDDPDATNLGKSEVLVLCDTAQYYPRAEVDRLVHRAFAAGDTVSGDATTAFDLSRAERTRPQAILVRGRDPQRPVAALGDHDDRRIGRHASLGHGDPNEDAFRDRRRLIYESQGTLEDRPPVVPSSRQLQDEARADAVEVTGGSLNPTLMPGRVVRLESLDAEPEDLVVVAVEHHGESPRDFAAAGSSLKTPYRNELVAAPASSALRPHRRPKPRVDGFDAAIVVGPEGEEIYTDEHGRVKARFLWDLESASDDKASAWLRVMQAWGGAGFGAQFLPRIGMEVAVAFMGGDVDRPVVAGCLHNGVSPPPFRYPEERTKLGIKTRVTPGSEGDRGWNEISIDDARGSEQIFVRAERNLDEVVLVDHTTQVGGNQSNFVAGDQTTGVRGAQLIETTASRTIRVEGPLSVETRSNRGDVVHGDHVHEVRGNSHRLVLGTRSENVDGDSTTITRGLRAESIEGPATRHVGTHDVPQTAEVFAHGDNVVAAEDTVRIRAANRIVLECGDSSIEVTPEGIRLSGKDIRTIASDQASMQAQGSSVIAKDEIEIAAREVHVFAEMSRLSLAKHATLTSDEGTIVTGGGAGLGLRGAATLSGGKVIVASKGASLVLDTDAKLDGALVKLNCGGEGGGVSADERDPKLLFTPRPLETKPIRLRVLDENLDLLAGKHYELRVEGRPYAGVTDAGAELQAQIPEEASVGQLTVWPDAHPDGRRIRWAIEIEVLPRITTPSGARVRLTNLGYYEGPPVEEVDERLEASIKRFQVDHELPASGKLDGATVVTLREVHGH